MGLFNRESDAAKARRNEWEEATERAKNATEDDRPRRRHELARASLAHQNQVAADKAARKARRK